MPDMRVTCPLCNAELRVPSEAAGKRMRCPICKVIVRLDGDGSASALADTESPLDPVYFDAGDAPPPVRRRDPAAQQQDAGREPFDNQPSYSNNGRNARQERSAPAGTGSDDHLGIACMVLGGVSLHVSMTITGGLYSLPASFMCLVFGGIGIKKSGIRGGRNSAFSIAGMAMGGVAFLLGMRWVGMFAMFVSTASASAFRGTAHTAPSAGLAYSPATPPRGLSLAQR